MCDLSGFLTMQTISGTSNRAYKGWQTSHIHVFLYNNLQKHFFYYIRPIKSLLHCNRNICHRSTSKKQLTDVKVQGVSHNSHVHLLVVNRFWGTFEVQTHSLLLNSKHAPKRFLLLEEGSYFGTLFRNKHIHREWNCRFRYDKPATLYQNMLLIPIRILGWIWQWKF